MTCHFHAFSWNFLAQIQKAYLYFKIWNTEKLCHLNFGGRGNYSNSSQSWYLTLWEKKHVLHIENQLELDQKEWNYYTKIKLKKKKKAKMGKTF